MSKGRILQPWLILLVYVGPLVLAAVAYVAGWRPVSAPHGELLEAPVALPELALTTPTGEATSQEWLKRRWSLIYMQDQHCGPACIERLNQVNQVRLALGKHMGRAQVVLIYNDPAPRLPEGADVLPVRGDDEAGTVMSGILEQSVSGEKRVYVTDPLGQLVIAYAPDFEQRGLLEDLERLLALR